MMATTERMQKKSLARPDQTRSFDKGKIELVTVNDVTFGRATLQPGWKWSESIKPVARLESCEMEHLQYIVSGRIHIGMDDGREIECGPGDVINIGPRHNAWVVGKEPLVSIELRGMQYYEKPR